MTASALTGRHGGRLAWVALVVVYIVWGSTYLAIRVAVRDLPSLTLAGLRYLVAGVLLYPIALRTGGAERRTSDRPRLGNWLAAALVGILLLVLGNGGLSIGERTLDSGVAAVLVATVPLFMVLFGWPINHARPTRWAAAGLAVGLAGVAVLAGEVAGSGHLFGAVVVLGASAAWGLGSVLASRVPLPSRVLLGAAMEMLVAGVVMVAIDAGRGKLSSVRWHALPTTTWIALIYLILFGSVLAFTAYAYALAHLPLPTVSTYAYVNPVVAVLLGVAFLAEPLTAHELAGTALVILSVILTLHRVRKHRVAAGKTSAEHCLETTDCP